MQIEFNRETTAIDVLRNAQQAVLTAYGPCCSSCESLLEATAARVLQNSSLDPSTRMRLMDEIRSLLGTARSPSRATDEPIPA